MKSAREWFKLMPTNNLHVWIAAIQKDAQTQGMRDAAGECGRRKSAIKHPAYNCGCDECAVFILAEAERLETGLAR